MIRCSFHCVKEILLYFGWLKQKFKDIRSSELLLIRICNIISGLNRIAVIQNTDLSKKIHGSSLLQPQWTTMSSDLFTTPIWNIFHVKPPKRIYQEQNGILMAGIFNPPLVDAEKSSFWPLNEWKQMSSRYLAGLLYSEDCFKVQVCLTTP